MQLDEKRTYRTRDGSRTGIRVHSTSRGWLDRSNDQSYWANGRYVSTDCDHPMDLIEEQPADHPFSYDACPVGPDGRRRAATRDGREVVLLCDDAPGDEPVVGIIGTDVDRWGADGRWEYAGHGRDLVVPLPPKRVVWVNLYVEHDRCDEQHYPSEEMANAMAADMKRLGDRAHRIEVDP